MANWRKKEPKSEAVIWNLVAQAADELGRDDPRDFTVAGLARHACVIRDAKVRGGQLTSQLARHCTEAKLIVEAERHIERAKRPTRPI